MAGRGAGRTAAQTTAAAKMTAPVAPVSNTSLREKLFFIRLWISVNLILCNMIVGQVKDTKGWCIIFFETTNACN
jgi:hypothetical protein